MAVSDRESPYPYVVSKDNPLEELGAKYLPSKRLHNYLPLYWMHFRDIRFQVKRVLEIGVDTGRSLPMWEEFFPKADIYGLDINPECLQHAGGRKHVVIGDQGDPEFLQSFIAQTGGFDIVIDDGSHRIKDQLLSFDHLFPALTSHGIYVLEDTGGCVCDYDLQAVNRMKQLVNHVMFWPAGVHGGAWQWMNQFSDDTDWLNRNTIGVAFYRWIVFVLRGKNPGDNPYLKPFSERPK